MEYIDNNNDYIEKIVKILKEHPEGLSINEIAKALKVHRHTVVKYIYQLIGLDLLCQRKIGPVKLCYLKRNDSKVPK
ncbi:hypothetical protein A3K64_01690 [Candidatus Micrarchaeota archaeon RBG_16_36_9]|nr:MAG: hypothetical protein A3K64_01690 [Candidatus Micrarchaeota archaeon RBG_16_36_9]